MNPQNHVIAIYYKNTFLPVLHCALQYPQADLLVPYLAALTASQKGMTQTQTAAAPTALLHSYRQRSTCFAFAFPVL